MDGVVEQDMSLQQFTALLPSELLKNIEEIWFNGNYGDFIMNPSGPDMVEYVLNINPGVVINVSTNGSARNTAYWQRLGSTGINVWFCLDGLADTHALYRQDTNFETILKNAQVFKSSGGRSIWQYTVFEHNQHQIEQAKKMSVDLGFSEFVTRPNARPAMPVYNREGKKVFQIGKQYSKKLPDQIDAEYVRENFKNLKLDVVGRNKINCESIKLKSLYIGAAGDIAPCCYLKLPRKAPTAGSVACSDEYLESMLNIDSPIQPDQLYFPLVQKSWEKNPHDVCKSFCGGWT